MKNLPHIRTFTGTDIALRRQWERLKIVVIVIAVISLLAIGGCGVSDGVSKLSAPDVPDEYEVNGCKVSVVIIKGVRVVVSPNCYVGVR